MRDFVYPAVITTARTWFKLGDITIRISGAEHIPATGGALLAINQITAFALGVEDERYNYTYILRVLGFVLILLAIVDKNLSARRRR